MTNSLAVKICKEIAPKFRHASPITDAKWATEKVHVMSLITKTPALQRVTEQSLSEAVLQSVSLGLTLNPARQHCYLIPRKARKRRTGESDQEYNKVVSFAYASPSYRGLTHIAVNSGAVLFMRAEVVFKDDQFCYNGPIDKPDYKGTSVNTNNRQEKDAIGAYAVAKTSTGDFLCEFIDRDTIQRIRQMSEMKDGAIWNPKKMWTEGWKKSAIRRLYKTMPDTNPRMDHAIEHLNLTEGLAQQQFEQPQEPEKPVEAVVIISDEQALIFHSMLTDNGIEGSDVDRWLNKLATRFEVDNYKNLPADKFNDAKEILKSGLTNKNHEAK